jgi:hypothetical protein
MLYNSYHSRALNARHNIRLLAVHCSTATATAIALLLPLLDPLQLPLPPPLMCQKADSKHDEITQEAADSRQQTPDSRHQTPETIRLNSVHSPFCSVMSLLSLHLVFSFSLTLSDVCAPHVLSVQTFLLNGCVCMCVCSSAVTF